MNGKNKVLKELKQKKTFKMLNDQGNEDKEQQQDGEDEQVINNKDLVNVIQRIYFRELNFDNSI